MIYNMKEVEDTLAMMMKMEETAGDYYSKCAIVFEQNSSFWHEIADEEFNHRDILGRIIEMIKLNPEKFSWNMPVQAGAIRELKKIAIKNIEKLGNNELSEKQAVNFAMTIEDTMTETSYSEILITEDPEIKTVISEIVEETADHKQRISEMVEYLNKE